MITCELRQEPDLNLKPLEGLAARRKVMRVKNREKCQVVLIMNAMTRQQVNRVLLPAFQLSECHSMAG